MFWPFTVWINCFSDLKNFENSRPSASNFKSFSQSLECFFSQSRSEQFWQQNTFSHIFWPSQKTSTLRERPPSASFHAHKGPLTHTVSHSHFENDNRLLLITIVQGFAHTFYRALFSVPYHVLKCKSKTNKKTGTKNLGWRLSNANDARFFFEQMGRQ